MDCADFLNRYSEYDDSLVPPEEADRFRAHMAGCEACTRYDRVLRKGRMLARQLPPVEPSDDFVPRLHARLWQESTSGGRALDPPRTASALTAMMVLLALAAGLGLLVRAPAAGHAAVAATSADPVTRVEIPTLALPPLAALEPREWPVGRVDREPRSSYSPLITGLPAYRGAQSRPGTSIHAH